MSDKVYLGRAVNAFESAPAFAPYSKVVVWYDDEHAFVAGDDSGRTLEVDLPWATQAITDDMLAQIKGFVYRPFEAQGAILDPATELGDGITVNAVYAPLADIEIVFGRSAMASIKAPADEEIDHEIPYQSPMQRDLGRKVTLGKAYFGTRITRANGLEIVRTEADGTEKGRVVLNSDVQAFYNDDGAEALYFDITAGKFRFRGDVEITGGTMNVNDNFIVDANGNLTINGNINLSGGTITWGSNLPSNEGGITADEAALISSTVVTDRLVQSPNINGATIVGGTITGVQFYGNEFNIIATDSDGTFNLYGLLNGVQDNFFQINYYDSAGFPMVNMCSPANCILYFGAGATPVYFQQTGSYFSDYVHFHGAVYLQNTVDFSNATVKGLSVVFK